LPEPRLLHWIGFGNEVIESAELERSPKRNGRGQCKSILAVPLTRLHTLWKAKLALTAVLPVWVLVEICVNVGDGV